MFRTLIAITSAAIFSTAVFADDTKPAFADYTATLKQEALSKGYAPALLDEVFSVLKWHASATSSICRN